MVFIRELTVNDLPLLVEMGGASLLQSHGHSAPAAVMQQYVDKSFSPENCVAELSDTHNIFYAIFYKEAAAGYFKIIFDLPHPATPLQPVTKMERLYLLQEFYGLGLGQQLMQKAIHLSKEKGEKGMWLNVWKGNDRAISFYKKTGFKTVGESEFVLTPTHANPNWVLLLTYETDL